MPIKKGHEDRCLKASVIFFFLSFMMISYLVIPEPVRVYLLSLIIQLDSPWGFILINAVPAFLYLFFLIIMNIFFFEGRDGYTKPHNWKALKNTCLCLIILLAVLGLIFVMSLIRYLNIFVTWLAYEVLFVNAFILCKSAYDKENPKNVVGKHRNI